jgi:hypothetical protein
MQKKIKYNKIMQHMYKKKCVLKKEYIYKYKNDTALLIFFKKILTSKKNDEKTSAA